MRRRLFRRALRVLAHVRHASRTHILKPRHVRGRGCHKRRARLMAIGSEIPSRAEQTFWAAA